MKKAKAEFKTQDDLQLAVYLNVVMIFLQFCFNTRMLFYMKFKFFRRYVSWIDMVFSIINLFMVFMILHDL